MTQSVYTWKSVSLRELSEQLQADAGRYEQAARGEDGWTAGARELSASIAVLLRASVVRVEIADGIRDSNGIINESRKVVTLRSLLELALPWLERDASAAVGPEARRTLGSVARAIREELYGGES